MVDSTALVLSRLVNLEEYSLVAGLFQIEWRELEIVDHLGSRQENSGDGLGVSRILLLIQRRGTCNRPIRLWFGVISVCCHRQTVRGPVPVRGLWFPA